MLCYIRAENDIRRSSFYTSLASRLRRGMDEFKCMREIGKRHGDSEGQKHERTRLKEVVNDSRLGLFCKMTESMVKKPLCLAH